jgi:O-antigen/teichoic acid export membrane protein
MVSAKPLRGFDMSAQRLKPAGSWPEWLNNVKPRGSLRQKLGHPSRLLAIFASLVGAQIGSAVLGLVFWALAARSLPPQQLGVGAALVAAMTLLSIFGVLGVGTLMLERFKLPSIPDGQALFSTGLSIAGLGGAIIAAGWLGLSAMMRLPGALGDLSLHTGLLLVCATALAAICKAFDYAVLGMGVSRLQLRRNLLASVIRIAVLCSAISLDIRSGQAILYCWIVGLLCSLLATPLGLHLSPGGRVTAKQRWYVLRNYWTAALGHHGLTLSMVSGPLMLPVIVGSIMSATQTAYFSQARLLSDSALMLPYFLTIALFAAVESTEDFRRKAPQTLLTGMILVLSLFLGAAVLGRVLLLPFGTDYSQGSFPLLLLLLASGPVLVIKDHFVVLRRVQGLRLQGAMTMTLWTAAELTGAVAGGLLGGITVLCLCWLVMSVTCALLALPVLLKAIRTQRTGSTTATSSDTNGDAQHEVRRTTL